MHARLSTNLLLSHTLVGAYTYIGKGVIVNDTKIGRYCSIAAGSQIGALDHSWKNVVTSTLLDDFSSNKKTAIGNGVWIGANTIIMKGVKVGEGAVIGANSFVKTDIPSYSLAFGTPAKVYKYRFSKDIIYEITRSMYWQHKPSKAKKIVISLKEKIQKM